MNCCLAGVLEISRGEQTLFAGAQPLPTLCGPSDYGCWELTKALEQRFNKAGEIAIGEAGEAGKAGEAGEAGEAGDAREVAGAGEASFRLEDRHRATIPHP